MHIKLECRTCDKFVGTTSLLDIEIMCNDCFVIAKKMLESEEGESES